MLVNMIRIETAEERKDIKNETEMIAEKRNDYFSGDKTGPG